MRPAHLLVPLALSLAGSASAQTTHDITLLISSFDTGSISVTEGDTVRWTWAAGFHNVESGVAGIPDGIFSSGAPTGVVGTEFEVTFDAAFLAANPVPNNDYDYYCIVHLGFGMIGTIHVDQPATHTIYGCGTNPAGSMSHVSGSATIGGSMTLGVDNPIGTQPNGSLAFLAVATAPAPGYPCGLVLPGLGMVGPYGPGELLVSIAAPNPILLLGPQIWSAPGTPSAFVVPIPPNASFAGLHFYFQGIIAELTGEFAVTDALDARLGL